MTPKDRSSLRGWPPSWVFAALVVTACSDSPNCDPSAPGPSLNPRLVVPGPIPPVTIDDQWAAIARTVPGGWGGMFLVSGTPTIYLVDPSKRSEAVAALYAAGVGRPSYDVRQAQVLRGRWDFGQLYDWYNYINSVAFARVPGLASTDIDEKQNRLVYGMVDDNSKSQLQALFQSLGVPCELAVVNVTGSFIPSAPPTREVQ